jgi:hypothetical protein
MHTLDVTHTHCGQVQATIFCPNPIPMHSLFTMGRDDKKKLMFSMFGMFRSIPKLLTTFATLTLIILVLKMLKLIFLENFKKL